MCHEDIVVKYLAATAKELPLSLSSTLHDNITFEENISGTEVKII